MRRISLALALVGAVAAGCTGSKVPVTDTSTGVAKGVPNVNYYVNLFNPPVGGYITSDSGGIDCGASSIDAGVPTFITGHESCGTNAANTQTGEARNARIPISSIPLPAAFRTRKSSESLSSSGYTSFTCPTCSMRKRKVASTRLR